MREIAADGAATTKKRGRARNPRNSGRWSHFRHFPAPCGGGGGVPGDVTRGSWTSTPNTQRGGAKYAKPPKTGRRQRKTKTASEIPEIPDSGRISAILPPRSVPRGSGSRPAGGGHIHPTPNAGAINTRNNRRWGAERRKPKTGPGTPGKFRILVLFPPFYRPVAFRGGPREPFRGILTSTPSNQRGGAKYAKPPHMGRRRKENKRPRRAPLEIRIPVVIPLFYRPLACRWVPCGPGRRSVGVDISAGRQARVH